MLVIYQVADGDHEFIRYNHASELPAIVEPVSCVVESRGNGIFPNWAKVWR